MTADLDFAHRLADAADAISTARFRANDLRVATKADRTHVTDADQAVERAIRELIAAERPGDAIFGEEYGVEGDSNRQWIIDPIDGTANYLRGVPLWGTLVALAVDGEVVAGVASMPALGQRWWAAKGGGAWKRTPEDPQPESLHVSATSSLDEASVSFQSIHQWRDAGRLDQLLALLNDVWRDRAYGDLWSYTLLAEGLIDAVGEFGVKAYDIAPLLLIVEEAGGRFTAATGEDGPWHGSALASNGVLHEELLRRINL
ncbi:inositol monophosphatase family protein [Gryllotalpicola protaetiae]|uniref:Histidinol-phosphatase n=1 Tax=Gryllotalpicola protaetiae TaxID=2419771 RepID=A0A387BVJ7_9MICO|nr:inositol monophosphatase family protein [Gryllotalpicola protaetiae]AYG02411.1 histidinol phosphatase [Gryllotalpicola protaetiae]